MAARKKTVKAKRLTAPLYVLVAPELKDAVDMIAFREGLATNEWVAKVLADKIGRPELAKIPRNPLGRRPLSVTA